MADDAIGEVSVLENKGHEEGGCLAPVNLLKGQGVEVLLAGGMGGRPLAGFQQVGCFGNKLTAWAVANPSKEPNGGRRPVGPDVNKRGSRHV